MEEHGPIISWREKGNKEKAGPGDPSAQGHSGHLSGPCPGVTTVPHHDPTLTTTRFQKTGSPALTGTGVGIGKETGSVPF